MSSVAAICIAIILLWGVWAFLFKVGADEIGVKKAIFYAYLTGIIISAAIIAYSYPGKLELGKGVAIIVLATLLGFVGTIIWYFALEKYRASIITPFTALYPVVTVLLSIVILKEKLSPVNIIGIILAIMAGVLLSI